LKNLITLLFNSKSRAAIFLFILSIGFHIPGFTRQKQDSTLVEKVNSNKTVKKVKKLITRKPKTDQPFNEKSEKAYLKYEGKIIRNIIIKRIGFESSITDTTRVVKNFFSHAANTLHTNTRESVIRNNLFVREGKPLNPYRLADNERILRNLDFVLDARIYVKPISKKPDSVDLLVVTRDVFSIGGSARARLPSIYKLGIKDINLNGKGQLIEFGQVFDTKRSPRYGYEALFKMTNINGSFVDATIAYTKLNNGISIGNENERSVSFKLSRELYQPFARFAGAIELSDNLSKNVYTKPDSLFIPYQYKIQDYWIGYSFGSPPRRPSAKAAATAPTRAPRSPHCGTSCAISPP
jgi:outer membrane protein assembly factor BamA